MKRALIITTAILMLSACGYRGALVLPEQAPSNQTASESASKDSSENK